MDVVTILGCKARQTEEYSAGRILKKKLGVWALYKIGQGRWVAWWNALFAMFGLQDQRQPD